MRKHTYRPDLKSVVERVVRRMDDPLVRVDAPFNIESRMGDASWTGEPDQTTLGVAELAAIVGGALQNYRLRFDPMEDRSDLYRPFLVSGGDATPVDVFVRRRGSAGEA